MPPSPICRVRGDGGAAGIGVGAGRTRVPVPVLSSPWVPERTEAMVGGAAAVAALSSTLMAVVGLPLKPTSSMPLPVTV